MITEGDGRTKAYHVVIIFVDDYAGRGKAFALVAQSFFVLKKPVKVFSLATEVSSV